MADQPLPPNDEGKPPPGDFELQARRALSDLAEKSGIALGNLVQLHTHGKLLAPGGKEARGSYDPKTGNVRLSESQLQNDPAQLTQTLAHETLGHALDRKLGGGQYASQQPGTLAAKIAQDYHQLLLQRGDLEGKSQAYQKYRQQPHELFAEAVAEKMVDRPDRARGVTRLLDAASSRPDLGLGETPVARPAGYSAREDVRHGQLAYDELDTPRRDAAAATTPTSVPQPPVLERMVGGRTTIEAGEGKEVEAWYEIRKMADIIASHEAQSSGHLRDMAAEGLYPTGLQPRGDYGPGGTGQQGVMKLGGNLKPRHWLVESVNAQAGTSVITPEGFVLNGNKRQMALQYAKHRGQLVKYTAMLKEKAHQHGFSKEQIANIGDDSVMVRVVNMDPKSKEAFAFARAGNEQTTYSQSALDLAASMKDKISTATIQTISAADPEQTFSEAVTQPSAYEFREQLRKEIPEAMQASIFHPDEEGAARGERNRLTPAGKELVQQILMSKAGFSKNLIRSLGTNRKAVLSGIEKSIPQILAFQKKGAAAEQDVTPQLIEALQVYARNPKMTDVEGMEGVLSKQEFDDEGKPKRAEPISEGGAMLLEALVKSYKNPGEIRKKLVDLNAALGPTGDAAGFGFGEETSLADTAAEALGVKKREGAEFGRPEGWIPPEDKDEVEEEADVEPKEEKKCGRGRRSNRREYTPTFASDRQREIYDDLAVKEAAKFGETVEDLRPGEKRKLVRMAFGRAEKEAGRGGEEEETPFADLDLDFFEASQQQDASDTVRTGWAADSLNLTPRSRRLPSLRDFGSERNVGFPPLGAAGERGEGLAQSGPSDGRGDDDLSQLLGDMSKKLDKLLERVDGLEGKGNTGGSPDIDSSKIFYPFQG